MSEQAPAFIFVEHVVWEPGEEWSEALESIAGRFARVLELDLDAVRAAGPLQAQLAELERWAGDAKVDLDRELGRWFDEHLSMHVRPDPSRTRAVRSLAAERPVHAVSALPPRAAESIARHAGCWRSIAELHAPVRSADQLAALVAEHAPAQVIAAGSTPLPADVAAASLA